MSEPSDRIGDEARLPAHELVPVLNAELRKLAQARITADPDRVGLEPDDLSPEIRPLGSPRQNIRLGIRRIDELTRCPPPREHGSILHSGWNSRC